MSRCEREGEETSTHKPMVPSLYSPMARPRRLAEMKTSLGMTRSTPPLLTGSNAEETVAMALSGWNSAVATAMMEKMWRELWRGKGGEGGLRLGERRGTGDKGSRHTPADHPQHEGLGTGGRRGERRWGERGGRARGGHTRINRPDSGALAICMAFLEKTASRLVVRAACCVKLPEGRKPGGYLDAIGWRQRERVSEEGVSVSEEASLVSE